MKNTQTNALLDGRADVTRDVYVTATEVQGMVPIMKIFVIQGWVVGALGTGLGVALGLAVCAVLAEIDIGIAADVYMVESLKVRVWPLEILLTVAATLIISHLASIYPALKAARQRPVDAMRYD